MITLSIFNIPENMTQVPELFTLATNFTSGGLGFAIWFLILIGTFAITSGFRTGDSVIASGFVSFFAAAFLWTMELLPIEFFAIYSVVIVVGAIIYAITSRKGMVT